MAPPPSLMPLCCCSPSSAGRLPLLMLLLLTQLLLISSAVSAAPFDPFEFSSAGAERSLGSSSVVDSAQSAGAVQLYALQRRSPSYANRRNAHPCRWKLCGAYNNYRRYF